MATTAPQTHSLGRLKLHLYKPLIFLLATAFLAVIPAVAEHRVVAVYLENYGYYGQRCYNNVVNILNAFNVEWEPCTDLSRLSHYYLVVFPSDAPEQQIDTAATVFVSGKADSLWWQTKLGINASHGISRGLHTVSLRDTHPYPCLFNNSETYETQIIVEATEATVLAYTDGLGVALSRHNNFWFMGLSLQMGDHTHIDLYQQWGTVQLYMNKYLFYQALRYAYINEFHVELRSHYVVGSIHVDDITFMDWSQSELLNSLADLQVPVVLGVIADMSTNKSQTYQTYLENPQLEVVNHGWQHLRYDFSGKTEAEQLQLIDNILFEHQGWNKSATTYCIPPFSKVDQNAITCLSRRGFRTVYYADYMHSDEVFRKNPYYTSGNVTVINRHTLRSHRELRYYTLASIFMGRPTIWFAHPTNLATGAMQEAVTYWTSWLGDNLTILGASQLDRFIHNLPEPPEPKPSTPFTVQYAVNSNSTITSYQHLSDTILFYAVGPENTTGCTEITCVNLPAYVFVNNASRLFNVQNNTVTVKYPHS